MSEDRQQATFDPTPQRIRRAEQGGQFARSMELGTALLWIGGITVLSIFGAALWAGMQQLATGNLSQGAVNIEPSQVLQNQLGMVQSLFWKVVLPILAGFALVAIIAHSGQIGFRFIPQLAMPKLSRISPLQNASRLFRIEQLISVALGLLKLILLAAVAAWILLGDLNGIFAVGNLNSSTSGSPSAKALADWLINAAMRLCIASAAIGVIDYGVRWRIHRRSLRMTEQEVRDEQRSMEPSQEVTARRRLMSGR